ncbi:hypothetical protein GWC77_04335 [Paraburkholderia sp. NMBU_R16]|uniref:hypothetical protein n=1 Tax=Paraburkholderia sp. NMBU_R16 TaxID=2698676 RepID=UPI001566FD54|nr:hypothetical protein [Paraburkholderia sp. NMBU_R16]NRO95166.1 hypothetical protein [Paraburkholderia sp. NMBU_R16]
MSRIGRGSGSEWSEATSSSPSSPSNPRNQERAPSSRRSGISSLIDNLSSWTFGSSSRQSNRSGAAAPSNRPATGRNTASSASVLSDRSEGSARSGGSSYSGTSRRTSHAPGENLGLGSHREELSRRTSGLRPAPTITQRASSSSNRVDFSSQRVESQTITERGRSLRTTGLDLCTGVAVGGIRRGSDGSVTSSSASVYHLLPGVRKPGLQVAAQINSLRSEGYEVSAYVAGGDSTSQAGMQQREAMEAMLRGMDVPYGSGPASVGGFTKYSQYLSAEIEDDGQVSYRRHVDQ